MNQAQSFLQGTLVLSTSLALAGCGQANYWLNKGYMDNFAKEPHTAQLLDYAVTFPRAAEIQETIPGGLEAGVEVGEHQHSSEGPDGAAVPGVQCYVAGWRMPQGGGEMEFQVSSRDPKTNALTDFHEPLGFRNIEKQDASSVEVGGLTFKCKRWTGYYDDAVTKAIDIPGIEYGAHDSNGAFVGLRGIGLGGDAAKNEKLTLSVLRTLRKLPPKTHSVTLSDGNTGMRPYGLIAP